MSKPALVATALGVLGVVLRLYLTLRGTPPTNSDEATMGLAALHIAHGTRFPVWFYGQSYMGTIEAYLAAPLIKIFGPSTVALRMPLLALYACFLVVMYQLSKRLYTPWLGTVVVGLLALGADRVVKNQMIAGGGYPESSPAVALLFLIAVVVAGSPRRWLYAVWGLVAGLMLWDSWLTLPYLVAAGAVLWLGSRDRRRELGLAAGTAFAGALPMIANNLVSPLAKSAPAVFLHLNSAGTDASLWERIHGGVVVGLPLGLGLCDPSVCRGWQQLWAPVLLGLVVLAVVVAIRRPDPSTVDPMRAAKIALALAALVSVLSYARSPSSADSPIESARYLSLVSVSLPVLVWPVFTRARAIVPIALALTMAWATLALLAHAPAYAAMDQEKRDVIRLLEAQGVSRLYTDYWSCDWIPFATDEKIICAVLGDDGKPGFDRVPGYRAELGRSPNPAYLAIAGSPLDRVLSARSELSVIDVAGYRLFRKS